MFARSRWFASLVGFLVVPFSAEPAEAQPAEPTLVARAVLPADTFAPGPPSGNFITPPPALRPVPFSSQPVQGFSALLRAGSGTFWAMPDNGFGAKENSADFLLRIYRVRPDFETKRGGSGTIAVTGIVRLRDPRRRVPFLITRAASRQRLLTGSDFDIESLRRDRRGDFWFGDEFGPFLLHTDGKGRVREAPIPLRGVKSPQNPTLLPGESPNLPRSGGFEGTAISPNGRFLYPSLEAALTTDVDQRRRFIFQFDLERRRFTGRRWQYRMEAPEHSIGDLTALDRHRLLVIERDNLQGTQARFKRIYLVDLRRADPVGFLVKREVLDLLRIRDPHLISLPARPGDIGLGDPFSFPFQTIESVLPLGRKRLLIANDNNYPFSAGRNPSRPDDNEMIVVSVPALP